VVLFADTFNTWFEPATAHAAAKVLDAAGFQVIDLTPKGERPLCCGRTFLSAGLVDEARTEASRTLAALAPWLERGLPVVGLEPSCLFTFRDELAAMLPGPQANLLAQHAQRRQLTALGGWQFHLRLDKIVGDDLHPLAELAFQHHAGVDERRNAVEQLAGGAEFAVLGERGLGGKGENRAGKDYGWPQHLSRPPDLFGVSQEYHARAALPGRRPGRPGP